MISDIFSLWTIIRILYSLIFLSIHGYILQFTRDIELKKDCPLKDSWKVKNSKLLSSLLIVVSGINVVIPASKFLSNLPIIGSSYVLLFCLCLFAELFLVHRLSISLTDEYKKQCKPKGYNFLLEFFYNKGITECAIYTGVLAMIFFYL
jgi:hypothetical protein